MTAAVIWPLRRLSPHNRSPDPAHARLGSYTPTAGKLNIYRAVDDERFSAGVDDALEAFQRAVEVAEEIDGVGVADAARSNMGNVYLDQGRHIDEVLDIYWEDVRACRKSDPPQRHHEAITLVNIGGALAKAERFAEALSPL